MNRFRYLLPILFAIAGSCHASGRFSWGTLAGEIPFALTSDGRIYVTAFVNGSDSLRFLVDTGASTVVLNTNSARLKNRLRKGTPGSNLGTTGVSRIEYSKDNSIRTGTLQYEQATCAHIPYPRDYYDGVLGLNGLAAFNIEINYDDKKIYCYAKDSVNIDPAYVELPFEYRYAVPFLVLPVRLDGVLHDLTLEVDTGSDRVIDLCTPFVKKHGLLEKFQPFATAHIRSSDGGSGILKNVFFDEVIVGPYRMPRVAGAFSTLESGMLSQADIDGMIGNNFLRRFNIFIDFAHCRIYLQPNNYFYTPFYDFLVQ